MHFMGFGYDLFFYFFRFYSFLFFIIFNIIQANALACQGKYEAGSIPSFAANASLFVAQHKY